MRWLILVLTLSAVLGATDSGVASADDKVSKVIARARKLEELGQPDEATATLAQGFRESRDLAIIDAWTALDAARFKTLDAQISNRSMPQMPEGMSAEEESRKLDRGLKEETWKGMKSDSWLSLAPQIDMLTNGPARRAIKDVLSEHRTRMLAHKPTITTDQDVRRRLESYDSVMGSLEMCTKVLSQALRDADEEQLEEVARRRKEASALAEDVRKSRGMYVSNDYLAPRIIDAAIHVQPDDCGVVSPFVSKESLEHAAERLGEVSGDIKYASKDIKRMWLSVLREMKQASGEKQYKDLEATATLVGDLSIGPEQWRKTN